MVPYFKTPKLLRGLKDSNIHFPLRPFMEEFHPKSDKLLWGFKKLRNISGSKDGGLMVMRLIVKLRKT